MHISRKRLLISAGGITAVGAAATLVLGSTLGLFSATETSGTNSFTAGTVSVGLDSTASVTCSVTAGTQPTNMVPGDSSAGATLGSKADQTCSYNVKYTGSAPAWVAVDVAVANGGTALFTSGADTGIQFYLKDGTNTYVTSASTNGSTAGHTGGTAGTTYAAQTTGTATALPAAGIANLLVNPGGATPTAVSSGAVSDMNLDYLLPLASGNTYQGGSVTVTLTFHAVQATNNALPAGCQSGWQCTASGSFGWS